MYILGFRGHSMMGSVDVGNGAIPGWNIRRMGEEVLEDGLTGELLRC